MHADLHGFVFGIFQHQLICAFISVAVLAVAGHFLEIGLALVGGHIERIAQLETHFFVLSGVVYAVFANELGVARLVLFVHPHNALGQGHAQARTLFVFKLHEHAHLEFLAQVTRCAAVVIRVAFEHKLLAHRHPCAREQGHLFGLVFGNGGGAVQRIQVVFEECFFRHGIGI